jgi:hypothetical protein
VPRDSLNHAAGYPQRLEPGEKEKPLEALIFKGLSSIWIRQDP